MTTVDFSSNLPTTADETCALRPYKGLDFFTATDAPLFSQRDEDVDGCVATLDNFHTRVLLLHGASGVGKSSFLRAALIPRLENPTDEGQAFFFLRDASGAPAVVRCTADPIARLYETLIACLKVDARVGKAGAQALEYLGAGPAEDRKKAVDTLISALRIIAKAVRTALVIVVDQAEEVLTQGGRGDKAANWRSTFFYLLEELSFGFDRRGATPHAIVSMRTEFYGQFTNHFWLPPTTLLSSSTLPTTGYKPFALAPITEASRLAEIVRLPTRPPFGQWGFEFAEGVPERIADDVLALAGDSSTLPVLQIVCLTLYEGWRDAKTTRRIGMGDYEAIRFAAGALDSHIDKAVAKAIADVGGAKDADVEADHWKGVLCVLVGQREVGAITGLVRKESELLAEASKQKVACGPRKMLSALSEQESPVVRRLDFTAAQERFYGLGHDCLGEPLLRWRDANEARISERARLEEARKREREADKLKLYRSQLRTRMVRTVSGLAILAALAAFWGSSLIELRDSIASVEGAALRGHNEARSRILALVAVTKASADLRRRLLTLRGSGHLEQALRELRDTLWRAPAFGGYGVAALEPRLGRVAFASFPEGGPSTPRAPVRTLQFYDPGFATAGSYPRGQQSQAKDISVDLTALSKALPFFNPLPTMGFIDLTTEGIEAPGRALVVSPTLFNQASSAPKEQSKEAAAPPPPRSWADGVRVFVDGAARPVSEGDGLTAIATDPHASPFVDFAANSVTLTAYDFAMFTPPRLTVLRARSNPTGVSFEIGAGPANLTFTGGRTAPPRIASLAPDCLKAVSAAPEGKHDLAPVISTFAWNSTETKSAPLQSPTDGEISAALVNRPYSVGIARGCGYALLRGNSVKPTVGVPTESEIQSEGPFLSLTDLVTLKGRTFHIPNKLGGFPDITSPNFYGPPLVADRPKADGSIRAAWPNNRGIAIVDLPPEGENVNIVLDHSDQELLLGLSPDLYSARMTISDSGDALLVSQQRGFSMTPFVNIFDLRPERKADLQRLAASDPAKLLAEACAVASFLPHGNQLNSEEFTTVVGDLTKDQPCAETPNRTASDAQGQ